MHPKLPQPVTVADFDALVPDEAAAEAIFTRIRWPDGVCCPGCGSREMTRLQTRKLWQCRTCRAQTSIRSGFVLHRSKRSLRDWLFAAWRCSTPGHSSALGIARALGSRYDSTWLMVHKIRAALAERGQWQLEGVALLGVAAVPAPKAANGDPPDKPPVLVATVLDEDYIAGNPPDAIRFSVAADPAQTPEELRVVARERHAHWRAELHVESTTGWYARPPNASWGGRTLSAAHRAVRVWLTDTFGGVSRRYMSNYLAQLAYVDNRLHRRDELFAFILRRLAWEPWRPRADLALPAP
mgnify:CR=1 FL=1